MRIVSREELMAMPPGTLYHDWQPCCFGDLCIKGESLFHEHRGKLNDWWEVHVPEVGNAEEMLDHLDQGESIPVNLYLEGREALFDDKMRYAVWERADVEALHARLGKILEDK